jgi:RHS repeat-associated protein
MDMTQLRTTLNNFGYCEQFGPDLEMYNLRARYYNPQTGRFWTADSVDGKIAEPPSLHRYLYAQNNPVSFKDASGHDIEDLDLDSIGFVVVGHT